MNQFPKIKNYELLNNKVYRLVKEKIINGTLKPGNKISEGKIAEQMGISRTPVREAIHMLNVDGLVHTSPNKGSYVIDPSIHDFEEIMQIRMIIEGFATGITAQKITDEEILKLEKIIKNMGKKAEEGNITSYTEFNAQFHKEILAICGNKKLIKIHENLSGQEYKFTMRSLTSIERLKYSVEEHTNILEALKKRDSQEAERLSRLHAENVIKSVVSCEKMKKGLKN